MEFESARDLKEEALARFVTPPGARYAGVGRGLAGRLRGRGALVSAAAWAGDLFPQTLVSPARAVASRASLALGFGPSFGLGVAMSEEGDYRLAVRYPWRDESDAPHLDELTDMARGEVDVQWTGPITAAIGGDYKQLRERRRPVMIGSSVAHESGTAGTVCAFVQRGGGAAELLSCNHVLADCDRVPANAAILQPGPLDGGHAKDMVGRLAYAYPIEDSAVNVVDCAVATLETGIAADHNALDGFGTLAGLVDPDWFLPNAAGQSVAKTVSLAKIGRTTGARHGRITAFSLTGKVQFPVGPRTFADMIEIEGEDQLFGALGDSGSLVFTAADLLAVGMIIAVADDGKSYIIRLDTVLSRLGAQLAT